MNHAVIDRPHYILSPLFPRLPEKSCKIGNCKCIGCSFSPQFPRSNQGLVAEVESIHWCYFGDTSARSSVDLVSQRSRECRLTRGWRACDAEDKSPTELTTVDVLDNQASEVPNRYGEAVDHRSHCIGLCRHRRQGVRAPVGTAPCRSQPARLGPRAPSIMPGSDGTGSPRTPGEPRPTADTESHTTGTQDNELTDSPT